jgi:hypothetical protein
MSAATIESIGGGQGRRGDEPKERRAGLAAVATPYRWIKLNQHCALTGDTPDAVHTRRKRRIWTDGVHCKLGPDNNLYVCPEEWNRWIEGTTGEKDDDQDDEPRPRPRSRGA